MGDYVNPDLAGDLMPQLEPWDTPDLAVFVNAIAQMFNPVRPIVYDSATDPGWGELLDVDYDPPAYLPYLGQYVGVPVPNGTDPTTARSMISAEQGQSRGTPASIKATVQRFLTGTQTVTLVERSGLTGQDEAYALTIVVKSSECPDPDALLTAVENLVKPGGIVVYLVQSSGNPWVSNTKTWSAEGSLTWAATDSTSM